MGRNVGGNRGGCNAGMREGKIHRGGAESAEGRIGITDEPRRHGEHREDEE